MVAVPGEYYLARNIPTMNGFDALPSWPLDRINSRFEERD
jgi:hypothetical protein